MSSLRSALDELRAERLEDLAPEQLQNDVLELLQVVEKVQAETYRRLAALERTGLLARQGFLSTTAWLRAQGRLAKGVAHRIVKTARMLWSAPSTARAHAEGDLTGAHLQILSRAADRHPDDYAAFEETLLEAARSLSVADLRTAVDYWSHNLDRSAALTREEALHERRSFDASVTLGGMVRVDGWLDGEGGATLLAALRAEVDSAARDPGDDRTPTQRRADALVEVSRQYLDLADTAVTGGERPHLEVKVDIAALAGEDTTHCEIDETGVVTPETARRIACDASVHRIITRGDSEVLDVGRRTRVVPPALRRALVLRDRGCRYSGCDRPHRWCDAHHLVHWADGGETNLSNLVLLCRRHHRRVHMNAREAAAIRASFGAGERAPPDEAA